MTLTNFEKLATKPVISAVATKYELSAIFQQVCEGQKFIDLITFCKALLKLYEAKFAQAMPFNEFVSEIAP